MDRCGMRPPSPSAHFPSLLGLVPPPPRVLSFAACGCTRRNKQFCNSGPGLPSTVVPKSCIGGSGTATTVYVTALPVPVFADSLEAILSSVGTVCVSFFCTLLLCATVALWCLLGRSMPGRRSPLGTLLWGLPLPLMPFARCLGCAGTVHSPILAWCAAEHKPHRFVGRTRGTASRRRCPLRLATLLLTLTDSWSTPPEVHDLCSWPPLLSRHAMHAPDPPEHFGNAPGLSGRPCTRYCTSGFDTSAGTASAAADPLGDARNLKLSKPRQSETCRALCPRPRPRLQAGSTSVSDRNSM